MSCGQLDQIACPALVGKDRGPLTAIFPISCPYLVVLHRRGGLLLDQRLKWVETNSRRVFEQFLERVWERGEQFLERSERFLPTE